MAGAVSRDPNVGRPRSLAAGVAPDHSPLTHPLHITPTHVALVAQTRQAGKSHDSEQHTSITRDSTGIKVPA